MESFEEKLWENYKQRKYTDVEIIIDSQHYFCHRVIISTRSSYFQNLFSGNFADSSSGIIEPRVIDNGNVFPLILRYLYLGDVSFINENNFLYILYLSLYFGIKELEVESLKMVNENLDVNSVLTMLKHVKLFCIPEKILDLISRNFYQINDKKDLSCLNYKNFCRVIASESLTTTKEIDVVLALCDYIGISCGNGNDIIKDQKDELCRFIRWDCISPNELSVFDLTNLIDKETVLSISKDNEKKFDDLEINPIIKAALSKDTAKDAFSLLQRYSPCPAEIFECNIVTEQPKFLNMAKGNTVGKLEYKNEEVILESNSDYFGVILGYKIEIKSAKNLGSVDISFCMDDGSYKVKCVKADRGMIDFDDFMMNSALKSLRIAIQMEDFESEVVIQNFTIKGFYCNKM